MKSSRGTHGHVRMRGFPMPGDDDDVSISVTEPSPVAPALVRPDSAGYRPRRRDFLRFSGGVAAVGGLAGTIAGSGVLAPASAPDPPAGRPARGARPVREHLAAGHGLSRDLAGILAGPHHGDGRHRPD